MIGDPRFAVLLLGYGGGSHGGAYLTDSMMVVIVDPERKTLTLLSLPRDTWAPLEFDGETPIYSKINTAYAFAQVADPASDRLPRYLGSNGPGRFAADTISRVLGVPIAYYVALDFQGFGQTPYRHRVGRAQAQPLCHFVRGHQQVQAARKCQYVADNENNKKDLHHLRRSSGHGFPPRHCFPKSVAGRTRGAGPPGGGGRQPLPRFRCTINREIAAGVMPEILEASPSVAGRCLASFWRTSVDRPRTLA